MKKGVALLGLVCWLLGCSRMEQLPYYTVAVSLLPQKYFVQQIGGEHFQVQVLVPPGHNPATYAPTARQIACLSRVQLYLRIGYIPFETVWLSRLRAANPRMQIIDTSTGVALIRQQGATQRKCECSRGVDPHIWLSIPAVKIQLRHIWQALSKLDPRHQDLYQRNYQRLLQRLDKLHGKIKQQLASLPRRKFVVFHPAWAYFARDYGLEQQALQMHGKNPSPARLRDLINLARREKIRVIFVQRQFDRSGAQALATEIHARIVVLDPLAYDWCHNMEAIACALQQALGGS